jgi:hypothetical protein
MTIHEPWKTVIAFNDEGEVDFVTKSVGNGDARIEYVITGSGDACKFAAGSQQLKIREFKADEERRGIVTYANCFGPDTRVCVFDRDVYSPVTRNDVETIVAGACEGLDADRRMKVQIWLDTILPELEEKSCKEYGSQSSSLDCTPLTEPLFLPKRPIRFTYSSEGEISLFIEGPT